MGISGQEYAAPEKPNSNLREKLDNILIDKIEFDEVNVQTVFRYLSARSRELDPEKNRS
jgi:hypothetical protein